MGDLRNALKKVQTSTRLIKLNPMVDIKEVSDGSVKEYLRIYHYLFLDYNAQIASDIVNKHNVELSYLNDKAFVDGVYRLCRDMLGFTPRLTKDQFFHAGFAQAKAEMAAEIIDRVRSLLPFSSTTGSSFASGEKESTVTAAIKAAKTASSSPNSFNSHRPVMASNLSRHHSARSASSTTHHIQMSTTSRANYQTNRLLKAVPTSSSSSSSLKDASTNNSSAHESSHQSTSSNTSSHSVNEDDHKQQQAAIKTNTSTPTSIGASESGLLGLIEKINDMHAKMDCLAQMVQRVDLIDKRLENVEKLVTDSQQQRSSERIASNESVSRLSKTCEGITNKMTLLETELLIIKQSISQQQQQQQLQQQSRTSRLSYDPNDSTTYETPHQSFMMMASPNVTRSNNETATNDDLSGMHDSTLNGTDLTPTLLTETKPSNTASASRLSGRKSTFIEQDDEKESELNRARDLLQKASLFTSSLTSSTAASNLLA